MLGFSPLAAAPLADDGVVLAGTQYILSADAGVFALTGQDVNLTKSLNLQADAGSFALTGQDALKGISEAAGTASYSLTGQDVNFTITRAHGTGSFTLTGQDALKGISEAFGTANYTLAGQDINFSINAKLDVGTFGLTGFASQRRFTIYRIEADEYEQGFVLRGNSSIEVTNGLPNSVDVEAVDENEVQLYELTENSAIVSPIYNEAA